MRRLRLLSLDGGGVRGLSSLIILEHLMHCINPDAPPKPCDYFDMIGGTSTGGLIAIMLGRLQMDVSQCISAYLRLSEDVFQPKRNSINIFGRAIDGWKVRGRFDSERLKKAIQDITVAANEAPDALLRKEPNPSCRVFVCATRADTGVNAAVLRSYSSNRPKEVECTIWEAGRATSAASTFFDSIKIGESGEEYIDGATACNNPVEKLHEEAQAIWEDQEYCIDCIVSIGTGQPPVKAFGKNLKEVASTLAKISTETQETADRFSATWARILGEAASTPKVYFRFNVNKGLEDVGLEEYKEKAKISASTKVYISGHQVSSDLKECAKILRYKTNPGTDAARVSGEALKLRAMRFLAYVQNQSAMDVNQHLCETRDPEADTFRWVGRHPKYIQVANLQHSNILHIMGKPGCGKSVLAKYIYGILRESNQAHSKPKRHVIFFACNEREEGRRTPTNILSSLISQFIELEINIPESLLKQWDDRFNPASWKFSRLKETFFSLMTMSYAEFTEGGQIICVVDALDECVSGPEREGLLGTFQQVVLTNRQGSGAVSFVVTSRPYADIVFPNVNALEMDLNTEAAVDKDLKTYISKGVAKLIQSRPPFQAYRTRIQSKLQDRADKMYLLVELLLDMMLRLQDSSPRSIEKLLASLPSSLSDIYQRIWAEIPPTQEKRARLLFSWILCAFRSLSVSEFTTGIATYDYNIAMQEKFKRSGSSITDVQNPLLAENNLQNYIPLDLKGDLHRLFGPLIQINSEDADADTDVDPSSSVLFEDVMDRDDWGSLAGDYSTLVNDLRDKAMRVKLCHQSAKDHFLRDPNFINVAEIHLQLAELCARCFDGTVSGDPDTVSTASFNFDVDTIERRSDNYAEYWSAHREVAVKMNPAYEGRVKLRKYASHWATRKREAMPAEQSGN